MSFRVLVVDDSVLMRNLIGRLIEQDAAFRVIGTARNGHEAIDQAKRLQPDVITLDIEMPEMNGLDALKIMMKERPTPTVILSSLTRSGASETISALQLGAVDFILKPSGFLLSDDFQEELLVKLKAAVQVPISQLRQLKESRAAYKSGKLPGSTAIRHIVAIGTSTGGPQALSRVLADIPGTFQHPIVIVQHMPPKFTASLARRLDGLSGLSVAEARDGEIIRGGSVYLAPGDYHMQVVRHLDEYRICLHQNPVSARHRPSVDELFSSVNKLRRLKRHYVLLTGMGSDGAQEMMTAKQTGAATTIAEAKESCVVHGMPRAAVEKGAVDYEVPLELMAQKIVGVTG